MPTSHFSVVAYADPQVLVRIVDYFARLGVMPSRLTAVESGGLVIIRIEQNGLGEDQARLIAEQIRGSALVETVHVHRGQRLLTPVSETSDDISAQ